MEQYAGSDPKTLGIIILLPIAAFLIAYAAWKRVQNKRRTLRDQTIDSVIWRPGFRLTAESRRQSIGEKGDAKTFEYVLYAAIMITTALAVMFYKASVTDTRLASFNVHVGVVYFGFIAWAFSRLNTMYHKRKLGRPDRSREVRHSRPAFGLTSIQFTILIVVFITALTAFTWALKIIK